MDYKEKYEKALERAKSMINDLRKGEDILAVSDLESMFPELAESEDERIRKKLVDLLYKVYANTNYMTCVEHEEAIAWLEKQGEKFQYWKPSEEQLDALDYAYNSCPDTERGNYYEGVLETIIDDLHKLSEKQNSPILSNSSNIGKDKQKSTDKVEPKFRRGEWITNGEDVWQIDEVKTEDYLLIDSEGTLFAEEIAMIDSEFHLWTIQDAKDGDVLGNCNIICMYKKRESEHLINVHINYSASEGVEETNDTIGDFGLYPATKEQRDTLMKAMADAGYTFDFEKKELKKISQRMVSGEVKDALYDKVSWSKEDESNWQGVIDEIQANKSDAPCYDLETYDRFLSWLKSIKQRIGGEK